MEPSAVRSQCQTLAVNPNEQINSVSSEVSLLELSLSAPLVLAECVFVHLRLSSHMLLISLLKEWKCVGEDNQTYVRAHKQTHCAVTYQPLHFHYHLTVHQLQSIATGEERDVYFITST